MHGTSKKLVLVLTTSVLVTKASKEDIVILNYISCICYQIWFKKSKVYVQVLINSSSKVNAMILGYILKLGLKICFINIKTQKIDDFTFKAFEMVLASF